MSAPRILVVDDDDAVRVSIAAVLRRAGYEPIEAANGRRALDIHAREPVAAILTDLNMPEMNGIELILELRESDADVPVIAISGGGKAPKELLLRNAEMLGAVETLQKPFEMAELRDLVARVLGDSRR